MPLDIFLALFVFAFVMSFTPGPNNILLAASGVNFGFARTVPHMLGVTIGFAILILACSAGVGVVFAAVPGFQLALKIAGAAYMLWLAFKVATARLSGEEGRALGRPFSFLQAVAFQWINPKAVIAALKRDCDLCPARPPVRRFPGPARGADGLHHRRGRDLDGFWGRPAPPAARSGPCPAFSMG
jgi:hypothetical protein